MNKALKIAAFTGPLLLMALLACTPGISFMEDLGRHLLLGQIIVEQHVVPDTNYLTYTHPDFPFVNHHWLSEVCLFLLHKAGGLNGLILWKMLMMTAALGIALFALRPSRGWGLYWLAGILAAVMLSFRAHIRPELFTYLFTAFYLWSFEAIRRGAKWPRWALLPVACFWANAHIYFIFGIGMVAAFVIERQSKVEGPKPKVRELIWLVAVILVSCINPNGAAGLLYPFTIFTNYGIGITENMSPIQYWHTVLNPMLIALPFMSGLVLWAAWASCGDGRIANRLIALAALAATWAMARSAPLLALTSLPLIASALSPKSKVQRPEHSGFRSQVSGFLAFALNLFLLHSVLSGSFSRVFPSPIAPTPFGFDREQRFARLTDLKSKGLKGPVFTDYNLGSLVEYELYPEPGYCDNRPEAFPASFWRSEYLPSLALTERWEQVCAARKINAVIVSLAGVKEAYIRELTRRPEWVLVHLDEICAVFVRNSSDNAAILDSLAFNPDRVAACLREIEDGIAALSSTPWWRRQVDADVLVYKLYGLICIGRADLAWLPLKRLHGLYPDYQIVHELMRVTVPPEEIPRVESVMARRGRWPLAAKQVLDYAHHLAQTGRGEEAGQVLKRGRWFFPLSPGIRDSINAIEDSRYRP